MRTSRVLTAGAVALTGALALSACGSDNNSGGASGSGGAAATGGSSAAAADCFSGTLNGEGSTAQKNAIEAAIKAYQTACSDATINYNATGSGAGIKQFTGKQVDFAGSDSALKTDGGHRGQDRLRLRRLEPADGRRPDRDRLQRQGRQQPGPQRRRRRQDLQRRRHHLERPGHHRAELRRHPAGRADQGVLPLRRVGHHRELHQLPQGRRAGRLDRRARPRSGPARARARRSRPVSPSAVKRSTDGGITYTEWSYATQNKLAMAKIDNGSGTRSS